MATATLGDGTVVAVTGCYDGRVQVWNATDGRGPHTLTGHEDRVTRVVTGTAGGRHVAVSGDRAGRVLVWDLAEGRQLHELASAGHGVITCLALGGDGELHLVRGPPRGAGLSSPPEGRLASGAAQGAATLLPAPAVVTGKDRGTRLRECGAAHTTTAGRRQYGRSAPG